MNMILKTCLYLSLAGLVNISHGASNDGSFGRLFSRPSERAKLDQLRQSQQLKVIVPKAASTEDETAPPPVQTEAITMQGYVKRGDGKKNTLWINGQPVQEDDSINDLKIGHINKQGYSKKGASTEGVNVKIPASGKQIHLKAGQMYEPESNQILDLQVVEKAKRLNLEETGVIDDRQLGQPQANAGNSGDKE